MLMLMLMLATKLEVICSTGAIGKKGGAQPPHSQSVHCALDLFCRSVSDTYRVKDVVIVTPHTAGVLVAVVRIGEPLWGRERWR